MRPDELQEATGCSAERAMLWAEPLTAAMAEYEIDTAARQAAFLAQIVHESGRFKWVREIWGPTPAQMRYGGRDDLGNTRPAAIAHAAAAGIEVGRFYSGHGLIQVTGYDNHLKAGLVLGIDAAAHPELLEQPEHAARSAGDFWRSRGLNEAADVAAFERITRKINGGMNGYTDRCVAWDRAKRALAVA